MRKEENVDQGRGKQASQINENKEEKKDGSAQKERTPRFKRHNIQNRPAASKDAADTGVGVKDKKRSYVEEGVDMDMDQKNKRTKIILAGEESTNSFEAGLQGLLRGSQ
jgi:hypothetical protein